jgi:hypothetical protein
VCKTAQTHRPRSSYNARIGGEKQTMSLSRAGAQVSDLKFPKWQSPYLRALMETEQTKLGARLEVAQKAILLRMKSIPESQEETQALEDALRGLSILKRERIEFQEPRLQPFRTIKTHMN